MLAGGRSVRMGQDKAALVLNGQSLLERSVQLVSAFTSSVHVSAKAEQAGDDVRRRFSLLFDPAPDLGPGGGLLAAFLHDSEAAWLVLACDMPGVDAQLLQALVANRDPARGATAWRGPGDGLPEPLCAIWEPATLARLAAEARQPGKSPVSPRAILAAADPLLLNPVRPAALISINTLADLHPYREHDDGHKP